VRRTTGWSIKPLSSIKTMLKVGPIVKTTKWPKEMKLLR
jgi:hypothetical protein